MPNRLLSRLTQRFDDEADQFETEAYDSAGLGGVEFYESTMNEPLDQLFSRQPDVEKVSHDAFFETLNQQQQAGFGESGESEADTDQESGSESGHPADR